MGALFLFLALLALSLASAFHTRRSSDGIRALTTTCSTCGRKNQNRIVGGVQTGLTEFPWMAAICDRTPCNFYNQFCGGSIINEKYILTAAHCLEGFSSTKVLYVSVGDHNLAVTTETDSDEYHSAQLIMHESYNPSTVTNDIALIKLSQNIVIKTTTTPVCLARPDFLYGNQNATVTGWGLTTDGGAPSKVLREVDVKVLTNDYCNIKYGSNMIKPTMLCASKPGKDSCQGDSGGPLVFHVPSTGAYEQIGIVSWGYACAGSYPGVYTRVNKYLGWIASKTAGATYCV